MHSVQILPMLASNRSPGWTSQRRLLEQKISDLHRCYNLAQLKQTHAQIIKSNLHHDPFIAPKLISAYSLCYRPSAASSSFHLIPNPNTLLYNTLIRALAHNSLPSHAFSAFCRMQRSAVLPDNFTYPFLLKACSDVSLVQMLHTHILKWGHLSDIFVPNSLIDSYSKGGPGGVSFARKVFDKMPERDVVSWNSMIAGLVRAGEVEEARRLFDEMTVRDTVSWNTMLDGHAKGGETDAAFQLFERMPERNVVSWSTVVSGYCKAGDMDMARMLFDKMPVKNLVSWTIMISGYAEKGLAREATYLFDHMLEAGLVPDSGTVISVLAACAESGLLGLGERIHAYVERSKTRFTVPICNALIDMYAKSGNLDRAREVFEGMPDRDLVSWNSMLHGLAMHGNGERALQLFDRMKGNWIRPDGVTLIGVLCACTHGGLTEQARHYFSTMEREYGIKPHIEHYGCMIDLLGRGGLLEEAYDLVKSMPWEPNAIIWGTLLGACRLHNNVDITEEVADQLARLEPSDAGNYAIVSNIYAAAGRWDGVARSRVRMKGTGAQKAAGSSWIELKDMVCQFTAGDRSHPQSEMIFGMLHRLGMHLKQSGYVPYGLWVNHQCSS